MKTQWQNSRNIASRIFICAELELLSPTHIGSGDTDSILDIPILRDSLSNKALLTGAAIAGALRAYLVKLGMNDCADEIFGKPGKDSSFESLLYIDDSFSEFPFTEIRQGVAIIKELRIAENKKKYDFELIPAGIKFSPCFELLLPPESSHLLEAFVICLKGLEIGDISFGKRRSRGFGECTVNSWKIWDFSWNTEGMLDWLRFNPDQTPPTKTGNEIDKILLNRQLNLSNERKCVIEATFGITKTLIIRADVKSVLGTYSPDNYHLRRTRNGKEELIISGTSIAGALRSRSYRICNTLNIEATARINNLFGWSGEGNDNVRSSGSRICVKEVVVNHPQKPIEMVQSRVLIDRFTGGASSSHLFSDQPIFGDDLTTVTFKIEMDKVERADFGLLLLVLKDLWLGDLTIGGESSIGRGILNGLSANLIYKGKNWKIVAQEKNLGLSDNDQSELQEFVTEFVGEG